MKKEIIKTIKEAIKVSKKTHKQPILTPREIKILEYRFGLDNNDTHTLEATGNIFGVTRERIRQIEAKAIKKSYSLINGVDI